ncbi:MAG: HAD hydrolase family protein [candidate division Zixibacteria bacterium]|nr:HAD hydrolase family protein [candidate division Zixibacteria bacterium]
MTPEARRIRCIAFDQDDTALMPDGKPSPEGLEAIEAALDLGIVVASVSGRNIDRSCEPFRHVPNLLDRLYLIANNGSIVVGPTQETRRTLLFEQRIPRATFLELLDYIETHTFNFVYSWLRMTPEGPKDSVVSDRLGPSIEAITLQNGASISIEPTLIARLREGVYPSPPKMLILPGIDRREAVLRDMRERFGDRLYLVKTSPDRIEVMHPEVNKKAGIEHIARLHGFTLDQVMAVGDGENDLPMLFGAGFGVVMGNAPESVRRKGALRGLTIAPPHHENGFAWAIRTFALGR